MGFHLVDILIIAAIGLALFGPRALQSMARSAGRSAGHARAIKDKLMSEIPVDEISKVTEHIPQVPLNSRQAAQMLLSTDAPSTGKKGQEEAAAQKPETTD
ncbi:MAG TPA: twin-arginine translocase TatA/TatE family subunit [Ktedonobacteraceae bacterium]|jgi:Sec-independent protein translocase protein TatA|nr:twin-arginine translocase TatA/TatE family subunit [Ktedonobacteraceae bacterium]